MKTTALPDKKAWAEKLLKVAKKKRIKKKVLAGEAGISIPTLATVLDGYSSYENMQSVEEALRRL